MNDPNKIIADIIDNAPLFVTPDPRLWDGNAAQGLAASPAGDDEGLRARIAECAALDHSDTDNAKRLRTYFGGDIVVMQEAGTAGGAWLAFNGQYWDLNNGAARVTLMATNIGDYIVQEADHLCATPDELELIDAAASAKRRRDGLELIPKSELTSEQKGEILELDNRIEAGAQARAALDQRKTARRKFGTSSKNRSRIEAMMTLAAPALRRDPGDFNVDPYLVATQKHTLRFVKERDNGCPDRNAERSRWRLDVREGHDRADLCTALVPVIYDPTAVAVSWHEFLDRFMPATTSELADKRRTLQQYCGVGLLGVTLQRVMYHYGLGSNGKSVFLETLMQLLGPSFAVSLPAETLVGNGDRSAGQASPDIMRLFGKRMLRVHEVPPGKPLQESLIKQITGGEEVTARTLFKGYVDFVNKTKPHMSGNGFPTIDGTDNGIWRRMLVMHWTETIPDAEQKLIGDVVARHLTEAPGILNWLIDGALDFLNNNGLFVAPAVQTATQDYRDEMDIIGQFIRDCVEPAEGETVTARTMYDAFCSWCLANAKRPVSETKFGRVMKTRFMRRDGRIREYLDVRLRDVPARPGNAPPLSDPSDMAFAA